MSYDKVIIVIAGVQRTPTPSIRAGTQVWFPQVIDASMLGIYYSYMVGNYWKYPTIKNTSKLMGQQDQEFIIL